MNDAFQYKRLYHFSDRIKNKALAVFGMCVYAQWAVLPLILIDIWCAFGSVFLKEGRLIFNWLHQNEMKFIYNARKHFQNDYGQTWRYFTGKELPTVLAPFYPYFALLYSLFHAISINLEIPNKNFENHLKYCCCLAIKTVNHGSIYLVHTFCVYLVLIWWTTRKFQSTHFFLQKLLHDRLGGYPTADTVHNIRTPCGLPVHVFSQFNMTWNWNFHVNM